MYEILSGCSAFIFFDDGDHISLEAKTSVGMLSLLKSFDLPNDYVFHGYLVYNLCDYYGLSFGDTHEVRYDNIDDYIKKLEVN